MSNKKKIVIVISVISIMILCFSISSFAVSYPSSIELNDGDVIVFKDIVTNLYNGDIVNININFNSANFNNNYIGIRFMTDRIYYFMSSGGADAYYYNTNRWTYTDLKSITIRGNQIITNQEFINWLYDNAVSGLPDPPEPPPHLEPSFWETVSGFFSEALASGTAIVNWMTITPIALIPLALYCLIVIIAITKRMIKG